VVIATAGVFFSAPNVAHSQPQTAKLLTSSPQPVYPAAFEAK
jgi:hypothetical protein